MARGTVKKKVDDKGFGFISTGGGRGTDVFFHCTAVENNGFDALQEGQAVEFDLGPPEDNRGKGPRAQSVHPV